MKKIELFNRKRKEEQTKEKCSLIKINNKSYYKIKPKVKNPPFITYKMKNNLSQNNTSNELDSQKLMFKTAIPDSDNKGKVNNFMNTQENPHPVLETQKTSGPSKPKPLSESQLWTKKIINSRSFMLWIISLIVVYTMLVIIKFSIDEFSSDPSIGESIKKVQRGFLYLEISILTFFLIEIIMNIYLFGFKVVSFI